MTVAEHRASNPVHLEQTDLIEYSAGGKIAFNF
jgi:hypothetical protein